jgi:hypothetical protein
MDHMALTYLVNKPQLFDKIARWLLLFLEYDFIVIYKPQRTHLVVDVLFCLLHNIEPQGVPDQMVDVFLFTIQHDWLSNVSTYLHIEVFPNSYPLEYKRRIALKALHFILLEGNLHRPRQGIKTLSRH